MSGFAVLGGHVYIHPGRYTVNVQLWSDNFESSSFKTTVISTIIITK